MAEASMTLYELSKQMVANEPPMNDNLFNEKINQVAEKIAQFDKYWMLLCRERYDFTVFITDRYHKTIIAEELKSTLLNRGQIIFIDEQPDGAWEIWIRDSQTNENFVYYLFDYSNAIIDCR